MYTKAEKDSPLLALDNYMYKIFSYPPPIAPSRPTEITLLFIIS